MDDKSTTKSNPSSPASSALEREADRVDQMMHDGKNKEVSKEAEGSSSGLNNPTQVEQDNRVAKAKADAQAAGGGPDKPEQGLNQDG